MVGEKRTLFVIATNQRSNRRLKTLYDSSFQKKEIICVCWYGSMSYIYH